MADGTHLVRYYRAEIAGDRAQSLELTIGYTPAPIRLIRGAVAAGWLRGSAAPFADVTLGLRLGGRIRFLADAGLRLSGLSYRLDEEKWRDAGRVSSRTIGDGRTWLAGRHIRLGVEARLR